MNKKKEKTLENKKEEIQEAGLNAIQDYFDINKEEMEKIDPHILSHLHKKAHLGMRFEREMNVSQRSVEMNYIRVFRLVAEDKKELKRLIKKSIPKYMSDD